MAKSRYPSPYTSCPCGSSKKAKFCCLKSGQWSKKPSSIVMNGKQNYSHPKCYAKTFDNCSTTISREHFISEVVLKQQEIEGGVSAFGFSFLGAKTKSIPINGMASKILCEVHNSALSPLDSEAGRLFKYSLDIAFSFHQAPPLNIFSGEDIELWLLKTLLGIFYSDQIQVLSFDGLSKREYDIDSSLIEMLFQQREWPKQWGLYLTEGMYPCDGHFLVHPNVEDNNVTGAHFRFCGLQFLLNLGAKKFVMPWFDFPRVPKSLKRYYRPHIINHHRDNDVRQLILTWQDIDKQYIDSRHGDIDYYHLPESKHLPTQELTPLFELMENPRSALDKYFKPD
jgi:hypothetical protein